MPTPQYYFESLESPTQYNIERLLRTENFTAAARPKTASFSDINLTLNPATQILEYKHQLATLIQNDYSNIMPKTFIIDANTAPQIIDQLEPHSVWILKPALLNNGTGIKIFQHHQDIRQHFLGHKRYDGIHVLQRYIDKPHLLNGHKYSFRMFVVITNFSGAYLYPHGYFNVCRTPYSADDYSVLNAHLTNEHLHADHTPNNWQIPTQRCPNFDIIFPMMQSQIASTLKALAKEAPQLFSDPTKPPAFSLFGFDFMLDEALNLWLLEVNHGPCFPKAEPHILKQHLYDHFWQSLHKCFVLPIINHETIKPDMDFVSCQ